MVQPWCRVGSDWCVVRFKCGSAWIQLWVLLLLLPPPPQLLLLLLLLPMLLL